MTAQKGTVYLVGAGPGSPDLLTVRAAKLLATAEVILYDDLVPDAILALSNPLALISSVGKRCGQPRITQQGINDLLVESARRNLSVVRLKSGDPMVFGRAAEELNALREANIPVEIVPGVSAAFAAAAAMQTPMTDRRSASKLILIAGQHAADKTKRAAIWNGPLPEDATLAIYMPGRDFASIAQQLRDAGLPADLPIAAISKAATPQQTVAATRLANLGTLHAGAAPLLLLVGRAMEPVLEGNAQPASHLAHNLKAETSDSI